ncbi:hypothetical protein N7528_008159 [Penicillium herquei]|nr:hypothetical protein N7528_008159 [Penicillium herquei]
MLTKFLSSLSLLIAASNAFQYDFIASSTGIHAESLIDNLPLPYTFETSNSPVGNASNSWWISSYLTGSDGHQYLVLSHLLGISSSYSIYRGSIFDIEENEFTQFSALTEESGLYDYSRDGEFNVSTSDFYFGSTVAGNATKQLRTASTNSAVQYDIKFDLAAPIILNTGNGGYFQLGDYQTAEWSMPAGRTYGTLVKSGVEITIDPTKSLTWYDRQWNFNSAGTMNWTWFQLHLDSPTAQSKEKLSIWVYDSENFGHRQWATTQKDAGINKVVPVKSFEPFGHTWTSPSSNQTYAQSWNLVLQDDTHLTVKSIYDDQELNLDNEFVTYEGFVTVSGRSASGEAITGYGLVEMESIRIIN